MPAGSKSHRPQQYFTDRHRRLQQNLKRLSNVAYAKVVMQNSHGPDFSPRIVIESITRIRNTFFYFDIWEDFRDIDTDPHLYGFKYSVKTEPSSDAEPLFRYECHPDIDDPEPDNDDKERGEKISDYQSDYGRNAHFHPYKSLTAPISRLHYPFNRTERTGVVFSIIAWLEIDLVKRFYDSGRYKAERLHT